MIPVRLKLRNFMSYRGDLPGFSFAGIHTACISGENGAGKSSLIDAMTWALWGKTRAASDDELISIGAEEVEVEFDFNASENLYRIIRKRSKAKKVGSAGISSLDLQIFSGGGFNSITGDTITKTQEAVKTLLRMDYDTFINSAYLRQGHADEFSKQPPAKRKEVLASILKLEIYDELAETARQKTRDRQAEKEALARTIEEIKTELAAREEVSARLDDAISRLEADEKACHQAQAQLDTLREQVHSLQNKQEQLSHLKADSSEREKQLAGWQRSAESTRGLIAKYEGILHQAKAIEEGFNLYTSAKKDFERMSLQLNQLNRLSEQKNLLEKSIHQERSRLSSQIEIARNNTAELEKKASQLPELKSALEKAESEQASFEKLKKELLIIEDRVKSLEEQLKETRFLSTKSAERIREIDGKIKLISENIEPHCPLCEKPLEDSERSLIVKKYVQEKTELAAAVNDSTTRQSEVARTLNAEMAGFKTRQTELQNKLLQNQRDTGVLKHRMSECLLAAEKLEKEKKVLQELEKSFNSEEYAGRERAELARISEQITAIDYDENTYNTAKNTLSKTESYSEQKIRLNEAEGRIGTEQEKLVQAEEAVESLRNRLELDRVASRQLEEEVTNLPSITGKLREAETSQRQTEASLTSHRDLVYSLKAKLGALTELGKKLTEQESRLKTVTSEEAILKNLAQAFGKKGIQGMLIEMAIPEIENEANRILGKMTDNRMALKLESQKQKKTGGVAETLDINISDEAGTRDYTMYSGGEAFRIDFALRIALSKLLANRSGAPLPTLIVDEGFGTQDSIGLEKVKEAINAIQDDFQIILVITHIDELKNAFNNRIEVTKTPEGSTINII